jgi:putative sugar O-methyltransferase
MSFDLEETTKNYLKFRNILAKKVADSQEIGRSEYWRQESEQFEYLFDASPSLLRNLRQHCVLITGIRSYEYFDHHKISASFTNLEKRLQELRALDPNLPVLSERLELGGFGFEYDGQKFNIDTLKFHEMHLALKKLGVLDFKQSEQFRGRVVEIGGGWGGFAETFLRRFPNAKYTIVDLPEVLIFSSTFLSTWYPDKKLHIFGTESTEEDLCDADILLISNSDATSLPKSIQFELMINSVSFQEMTSKQVREYISFGMERSCRSFYSLNRDRSNYNTEISSVREIMSEHLRIKEVEILETDYAGALKTKKKLNKLKESADSNRYRHVLGVR